MGDLFSEGQYFFFGGGGLIIGILRYLLRTYALASVAVPDTILAYFAMIHHDSGLLSVCSVSMFSRFTFIHVHINTVVYTKSNEDIAFISPVGNVR